MPLCSRGAPYSATSLCRIDIHVRMVPVRETPLCLTQGNPSDTSAPLACRTELLDGGPGHVPRHEEVSGDDERVAPDPNSDLSLWDVTGEGKPIPRAIYVLQVEAPPRGECEEELCSL